jgi:hypothetical protein
VQKSSIKRLFCSFSIGVSPLKLDEALLASRGVVSHAAIGGVSEGLNQGDVDDIQAEVAVVTFEVSTALLTTFATRLVPASRRDGSGSPEERDGAQTSSSEFSSPVFRFVGRGGGWRLASSSCGSTLESSNKTSLEANIRQHL